MKRRTVPLAALVAAIVLSSSGVRADRTPGDVNGDGRTDISDVILVLQVSTGLLSLPHAAHRAADLDGDGTVTIADAVLLLQRVLGLNVGTGKSIATWMPLAAGPSAPIYSLTRDHSGALWVSAGPRGLLRSGDAGATWAPAMLTDQTVYCLLESSSISRTLFAGCDTGLYRSDDGGSHWRAMSLVDGGRIRTVYALREDGRQPNRVYAAGAALARSDDGGETWRDLSVPLREEEDLHALGVDPWRRDGVIAGTSRGRVFRSDDAGATWRHSEKGLAGTGYRVFTLLADPTTPDRWFLGTCNGGFWRSADGGFTWKKAGVSSLPPSVNALIDVNFEGWLYAGTSTGPYRSDDAGDTWSPLGTGMEGVEVLSLAFGQRGALFAGTWTSDVGLARLNDGPP